MASRALSQEPVYPWLYNIFCGIDIVLPLVSSIGYLVVPYGTVQHFGGVSSPSANFWCMLTAAGDILVAYLCFEGLRRGRRNPDIRRIVVRSVCLYTFIHCGIFWYSHHFIEPQANAIISFYPISMAITATSVFLWGR